MRVDVELEAVEVFGCGDGGAFFEPGELGEAVQVAVEAFKGFHFGAVFFDEGPEDPIVGVCCCIRDRLAYFAEYCSPFCDILGNWFLGWVQGLGQWLNV